MLHKTYYIYIFTFPLWELCIEHNNRSYSKQQKGLQKIRLGKLGRIGKTFFYLLGLQIFYIDWQIWVVFLMLADTC